MDIVYKRHDHLLSKQCVSDWYPGVLSNLNTPHEADIITQNIIHLSLLHNKTLIINLIPETHVNKKILV